MKKILTLIALLTGTALVYGQGTVIFYTGGGTFSGNYTNMAVSTFAGGPGALGTSGIGGLAYAVPSASLNSYYYTLLIDTTTPTSVNPNTGGWSQAFNNNGGAALMATNNLTGAGGMRGPDATGYSALQNLAAGATVYFELVGWSANLGTTWAQVSAELTAGWSEASILAQTGVAYNAAANYFFGVAESTSNPALGAANGSGALVLTGAGGLATGQPGDLTLDRVVPIPEPGTLALAGLGGLSLLLFRRRK